MMSWFRRIAIIAAIALTGGYAVVALRGPQGMTALMEKRRQIQELQVENANLERENQRKRDRIQRLESSPSEQEMEIRKQLKLLRPGETLFILPDAPKPDASKKDATAPQ